MDISYKLFSKKLNNIELVHFINHNSIDIVSFNGAKPFLIHLILKNKLNLPTVAVVHSDYRYDFLNSKFKYFIFTPLSILGLKSFKSYICVSNNLKNLLVEKKIMGNKAVINNGIDLKQVSIGISSDHMRNKLKLKEKEFIYVMVARLHPIKNHKEVILAFKKLVSEFRDVKLIIVGDGDMKSELEKLILELKVADRIIMVGDVPNPIDYINAGNVSVLASLSEGGAPPLTVLESGTVKKSLIYTQVGDLESILSEDSGYKISQYNNENIYKAMKYAYLDKSNIDLKGENLYNIVINNFTIEIFWSNYFKIFKDVINKFRLNENN